MADPLSSVLGLATFACASSTSLYSTVRGLQSQDRRARALKGELGDLTGVLQSLLETVTNNPDVDFEALKPPLHRCGNACKEYGELIARVTKTSASSRPSVQHWFMEKYLQGDIDDFKAMLAGYKSTINIALANANIRVAAVTPRLLEEYTEMIVDTTHDLRESLRSIDAKIEHLSGVDAKTPDDSLNWQALLEEKRSIQQGLALCAQLSSQIEQLHPVPEEHAQFSSYTSAHKYVKNGLNATKSTVQALVAQLQNHEDEIDRRMDAMRSTASLSEDDAADLAQLRATKESIRQCIKVVSDADEALGAQRQNLFEDITIADEALNFTISTVGELVTARRISVTGRSLNVGGQISDESYQKSIEAMARRGTGSFEPVAEELEPTGTAADRLGATGEFDGRYGRGFKLSHLAEGADAASKSPPDVAERL